LILARLRLAFCFLLNLRLLPPNSEASFPAAGTLREWLRPDLVANSKFDCVAFASYLQALIFPYSTKVLLIDAMSDWDSFATFLDGALPTGRRPIAV
jgi:hypothetical protein